MANNCSFSNTRIHKGVHDFFTPTLLYITSTVSPFSYQQDFSYFSTFSRTDKTRNTSPRSSTPFYTIRSYIQNLWHISCIRVNTVIQFVRHTELSNFYPLRTIFLNSFLPVPLLIEFMSLFKDFPGYFLQFSGHFLDILYSMIIPGFFQY